MSLAVKAFKGMGMEGGVARWYARTTRNDMPEFEALAARIALLVPGGATVLEIAPGPGFLAVELARRGLRVRGVDISRTFIDLARRNAAAAGVDVRFERGDAASLPLEDASVDFTVCRAAFKNFSEPVKALTEMRRVLRTGGTALVIDMRRDVTVAELEGYVHKLGVNRLNRWLMLFIFRTMLIRRAYRLDEMRRMTEAAGWASVRIEASPLGFEAWMSK